MRRLPLVAALLLAGCAPTLAEANRQNALRAQQRADAEQEVASRAQRREQEEASLAAESQREAEAVARMTPAQRCRHVCDSDAVTCVGMAIAGGRRDEVWKAQNACSQTKYVCWTACPREP